MNFTVREISTYTVYRDAAITVLQGNFVHGGMYEQGTRSTEMVSEYYGYPTDRGKLMSFATVLYENEGFEKLHNNKPKDKKYGKCA